MKIEQIYTSCLAHAAYYIESKGEVAIIDPLRDIEPYIERANQNNSKIKYVFETHFHADFVSGHYDLAEKTGAKVVYGPEAKPSIETYIAKDYEEFKLGDLTIVTLHTPGHSMESTTYLLRDDKGKDHAIFTGDTLFIGDVGRPDLACKSVNLKPEDLASFMFDSLRNKIMPLADDLIVYPGHGAGSACGKNLSSETFDTLGNQKKTNYALRADASREEFINELVSNLPKPPDYFPENVKMNKQGYTALEHVLEKSNKKLSLVEFEQLANDKTNLILDVRHQTNFIKGFIPKSLFIGLKGSFAPWVGALIKNTTTPILLITEQNDIEETLIKLSRVGFDNVIGFLDGGFNTWKNANKEVDTINSLSAIDFEKKLEAQPQIFDVRAPGEYASGHIINSNNTPLLSLDSQIKDFPREQAFYIHCAGGYRSIIAASILKLNGIHNLSDIAGGFKALKADTSIKMTESTCPSKLNK